VLLKRKMSILPKVLCGAILSTASAIAHIACDLSSRKFVIKAVNTAGMGIRSYCKELDTTVESTDEEKWMGYTPDEASDKRCGDWPFTHPVYNAGVGNNTVDWKENPCRGMSGVHEVKFIYGTEDMECCTATHKQ
jgi:hypothetical protein